MLGKVFARIFRLPIQAQDLDAFLTLYLTIADIGQTTGWGCLIVVAVLSFLCSLHLLVSCSVSIALELDHGLLSLLAVVPTVELNLNPFTIGVLSLEPCELGVEILARACVEITGDWDNIFDLDMFLIGIVRGIPRLNNPAYCFSLALTPCLYQPVDVIPLVPLGH